MKNTKNIDSPCKIIWGEKTESNIFKKKLKYNAKQIFYIFTCFYILFLLIIITSCKTESENISEKDDIIISDDRDIQLPQSLVALDVNGGGLFYADGSEILEYDMLSGEETVLIDALTAAKNIYVMSGGTYIYDSEKNCVEEYDGHYNLINEYKLSGQIGVAEKLIKSGDTVLILFKTEGGNYGNKIYKIDIKENTQGYLNLKSEMYIKDIFFIDEKNILIIHFNAVGSAQLTKYNLAEEKKEFTIDDIRTSDVYYDMKSGYVYLLNVFGSSIDAMYENAEIVKSEITDGKLNIISSKKFSNHNSEPARKFYANDSGYIIWYQDNFIAIRKYKDDTSNILNIYMYGTGLPWFENSVRDFQKDYGVDINITSHDDYFYEKIKLKLLANDTDFDLFMIDTLTGIDIFTKGAYEPLDSYPGVMKNISEMYPGMQKLLKYNGNTIGIPMQQNVMNAWAFNEELAQKYDIDPPVIENGIWTIDEYYEYAKYVKEKSGGVVYLYSIYWLGAYMTEYINQLTGELTDDGENLKRIIKWHKDFEELWDDDIKSDYENHLFNGLRLGMMLLYDETLIPLPVINKNSKIGTAYQMLCVNRYSPNKGLAAQFLEYMTAEKHRYERMAPILFNEIDKYKIYETEITDRMRYNSDYLNILYGNSVFEYQVRDDNFTKLYFDLSDKYMNNEISLDGIANELYNKLKMITGE